MRVFTHLSNSHLEDGDLESLTPRKVPRQARSAATVEAIYQAAARVLAVESLAGFNTNRVAAVAGVSVGTLYQYFPGKSALMAGLIARTQEALAEAVEAIVEDSVDDDLSSALRRIADLAVRQQYGQVMLAAALDHEERRLSVRDTVDAAQARMVAAAQCMLDRHRAVLPRDLPGSAARDGLVIAKALVEADVLAGTPPDPDLSARVHRALLGYLTVSPRLAEGFR